jgi:hypothetical protein
MGSLGRGFLMSGDPIPWLGTRRPGTDEGHEYISFQADGSTAWLSCISGVDGIAAVIAAKVQTADSAQRQPPGFNRKTPVDIVDLEGAASTTVLKAISQADFVLILTQGSQLDTYEVGPCNPRGPSE